MRATIATAAAVLACCAFPAGVLAVIAGTAFVGFDSTVVALGAVATVGLSVHRRRPRMRDVGLLAQ